MSTTPDSNNATEAYFSLAEQYGLSDMRFEAPSFEDQTIDQEFQLYVGAPVFPPSTDVLKHWEIRKTTSTSCTYCRIHCITRVTNFKCQHSLTLPLTSSQF